ncbi:hypothetical protein [Nocardia sp. NPDC005825]|uniref:hypothetical protein n=1 Tax=unclassified Nocardia TaxID=2637762 RepID=UPI0033FC54AF
MTPTPKAALWQRITRAAAAATVVQLPHSAPGLLTRISLPRTTVTRSGARRLLNLPQPTALDVA